MSLRNVALGRAMRIGRLPGAGRLVAGKILEGERRVLVGTRPRQANKGNDGEAKKPLHGVVPHLKRGMTSWQSNRSASST